MITSANHRLRCLIIEHSGIIAAELETELRSAFNAEIVQWLPNGVAQQVADGEYDIIILDCPVSMPAFLNTVEKLRFNAKAFVFTHTHTIAPQDALRGLLFRELAKPYPIGVLLNLVSELLQILNTGTPVQPTKERLTKGDDIASGP
jgi:DNA-binding response OmpR family regulator